MIGERCELCVISSRYNIEWHFKINQTDGRICVKSYRRYWVARREWICLPCCSQCTHTRRHLRASLSKCWHARLHLRTRLRTGRWEACRSAEAEIHPATRKFAASDYLKRCISARPMDRAALFVRWICRLVAARSLLMHNSKSLFDKSKISISLLYSRLILGNLKCKITSRSCNFTC